MNLATTTFVQNLTVPFTFPVTFTHHLFSPDNPVLAQLFKDAGPGPHRYILCVDSGMLPSWPTLAADLTNYFKHHTGVAREAHEPLIIAGGEAAKNGWDNVRHLMTAFGNARLDRHNFILALGGGSLLDIVGFAAAIVHRGLRLVRLPTTVLAQCDAAVGVKNGMDEHGQKNFVGTFAPPYAVLNDLSLLCHLPTRYWRGGISEIFKIAIIKDAALFAQLQAAAPALRARDAATLEPFIILSARHHMDHIRNGGDPFEMGSARPLDFGHWSAHKLERLTSHRLSHGEAVAIGIALDTCYATSLGLLTDDECNAILSAMATVGLPLWDEACQQRDVTGELLLWQGLEEFREHLGGRLTVTLPKGIGNRIEVNQIDKAAFEETLQTLRHTHTRL